MWAVARPGQICYPTRRTPGYHKVRPVARRVLSPGFAMSTTPCPSCGMPRADELVGSSPCPVCEYVAPAEVPPEPAAEAEELPFADPEPAASGRSWFGAVLGVAAFAVGALACVGGLLAWQGKSAPTP